MAKKNIEGGKVTFTAKDYRKGGKVYPVTLKNNEFIRRFAMQILPKGFTKIRHYGIFSSSLKKVIIPILQREFGKPPINEKKPLTHNICRICGIGKLVTIHVFKPRAPPYQFIGMINIKLNTKKINA